MEQHRQPKGGAAMTRLSACLLMASAALVLMPQLGGREANAVPFAQPALTAGHMHQAQSASRATVREAQQLLGQLGYDAGGADGVAGRQTRTAIRAFQQDSGLPATGAISADLMAELRSVTAPVRVEPRRSRYSGASSASPPRAAPSAYPAPLSPSLQPPLQQDTPWPTPDVSDRFNVITLPAPTSSEAAPVQAAPPPLPVQQPPVSAAAPRIPDQAGFAPPPPPLPQPSLPPAQGLSLSVAPPAPPPPPAAMRDAPVPTPSQLTPSPLPQPVSRPPPPPLAPITMDLAPLPPMTVQAPPALSPEQKAVPPLQMAPPPPLQPADPPRAFAPPPPSLPPSQPSQMQAARTPANTGLLASAPGFRDAGGPPPLGLSGLEGQSWRFTDDNGAEMEVLFETEGRIAGPAFAESMRWSLEGGELWLLYETALGGRSARRGRLSGPNAMSGQGESNRKGPHGQFHRWSWRAVRVK